MFLLLLSRKLNIISVMKMIYTIKLTNLIFFLYFLTITSTIQSQFSITNRTKSDFWKNVQIGGGFGLSIGNGFTDVTLAPNLIYNFNPFIAFGGGLQGSIISQKDKYSSTTYGASLITLFNPLDEIQLSIELEQVRVNSSFQSIDGNLKNNFWNTGLFVGAGYRSDNATVGVKYNLLFNKDKNVYSDAVMPFVRLYF